MLQLYDMVEKAFQIVRCDWRESGMIIKEVTRSNREEFRDILVCKEILEMDASRLNE